jgi:hypothetical protein
LWTNGVDALRSAYQASDEDVPLAVCPSENLAQVGQGIFPRHPPSPSHFSTRPTCMLRVGPGRGESEAMAREARHDKLEPELPP